MKVLEVFVLTVIFFLFGFTFVIKAQNNVINKRIDLSEIDREHSENIDVSGDATLHLTIINKIPDRIYIYSVEIDQEDIQPLSWPATTRDSQSQAENRTPPSGCEKVYNEKFKDLVQVTDEKELPHKIEELFSKLNQTPNCKLEDLKKYERLLLIATTQEIKDPINIKKGQVITITIGRQPNEKDGSSKTWKIVYTTGSIGTWESYITFAFPIMPFTNYKEEEFFTRTDTASNTFRIMGGPVNNYIKIVPAVFFTFLTTEQKIKNFSFSWIGGLGVDLTHPSAFFGCSLSFYENLSINAGLALHPVKQLLSKYRDENNRVISENLNDDQLHTIKYVANPFIGLSYRISSLPGFGNGGNKQPETKGKDGE